jgi:hypothetical protein
MTVVKKTVKAKASGQVTNPTKNSLVKVVVFEDKGKWVRPEKQSAHYISNDAIAPDVIFEFETDQSAPFEWSWKIKWDAKTSGVRESANRGKLVKTFEQSGSFKSNENTWKMDFGGKVLGGVLTVTAKAGLQEFKRSIFIKGKNPSGTQVKAFSDSLDGTSGYDKVLMHEALGKNFINADGEPVVSFDKGFGITQVTEVHHQLVTYEQCWSWKENVKRGSSIYKEKRRAAISYLKSLGPGTYTDDELQMETWSRYNGGTYYEWGVTEEKLVHKDFTCDAQIANIGWNNNNELNTDHAAAELRDRDKDQFKLGAKGQTAEHPWSYTGVCYAQHIKEM